MALESKPLSIANVQDGKKPFLHTAYAWSSDGKDRFTLKYPNENLWLKSREFVDKQDGKITKDGKVFAPYGYGWAFSYVPSFKANRTYTVSCEVYNPADTKTTARIHYATTTPIRGVFEIEPKQITTIELQITMPQDTNNINLFLLTDYPAYPSVYWHYPKIEESDNYTIWTPAPSEDFVNAYPLYMGQYSDYSQEPSTDPSKYTWMRTTGQNGASVKSTKTEWAINTSSVDEPTSGWSTTIPTLEKGKYLWTRTTWEYTDGTTSVAYTVNYIPVDGSNGNGVKSIAVTYAVGTSGTTQPSTGWQATPPNVTGGQYLWTRIIWTFTDNSNQTTYSVARFGQDGISVTGTQSEYVQTTSPVEPTSGWSTTRPTPQIGMWLWVRTRNTLSNGTYTNWVVTSSYTGRDSIFISATAPSNPTTGTLWQKPNDPTVLKWNGTAWENWGMSINNIVSDNVIAENGMFKKVTGVEIEGATILNPYTRTYVDNSKAVGTIKMSDSQIVNDRTNYDKNGVVTNTYRQIIDNSYYQMSKYKGDHLGDFDYIDAQVNLDYSALIFQQFGNPFTGAEYMSTGIRLTDSRVTVGSSALEIHDLIKVETTMLDPASGWQRYSKVIGYTNTPTATRVGRTVQLAGAFKPINEMTKGQYTINQPLPVWARPLNNITVIQQGSGMSRILIEVHTDGAILVSRYGTTTDVNIPAGAWINISCVFVGRDLF